MYSGVERFDTVAIMVDESSFQIDITIQVLGAAINVYANKHKERQDRLIDMLISSHRYLFNFWVC